MIQMFKPPYRAVRPEQPLAEWIPAQAALCIVHRLDANKLFPAGVKNIAVLPVGGPQPGEVWVLL